MGALAVIAGCGEGSGSSSNSGVTPGNARSSVPAGETVATLADIEVGAAVSAKSGGKDIVVARPTAGSVAAFSAICTHRGCTVKPSGKELHCPCHGSSFSATTGQVIHGPAQDPLPAVAVHVENGKVVTGKA